MRGSSSRAAEGVGSSGSGNEESSRCVVVWGVLSGFSAKRSMSGSQEQQAASVPADSQDEVPKEPQLSLGNWRGACVRGAARGVSVVCLSMVKRLEGVKRGYSGVMSTSLRRVSDVLPQKKRPRLSFHARSPSVVGWSRESDLGVQGPGS